jgi:hypothetical protein
MRPLSADQMLRAWETGLTQPAVVRPLVILGEAQPGVELDALARLPLGWRDRRLLDLRACTFGSDLVARVSCPSCGESIEFTCSADPRPPAADDVPLPACVAELDGLTLELRPPDTLDLIAAAGCASVAEARRLLAERCTTTATSGARLVSAREIPDDLLPAIAGHLEAADPDADCRVEVRCPSCQRTCDYSIDIGAFLWSEIESEALRLLRDVHTLAMGYGWRESDILAMTPVRRQAYLELLG